VLEDLEEKLIREAGFSAERITSISSRLVAYTQYISSSPA
jgi:hypothetical protein